MTFIQLDDWYAQVECIEYIVDDDRGAQIAFHNGARRYTSLPIQEVMQRCRQAVRVVEFRTYESELPEPPKGIPHSWRGAQDVGWR